MEDKETKLREAIRGMVKEMLISVKENIDDEDDVAKQDTARAAEESSEAASAAALGGVEEGGEEEKDEPYEIQSESTFFPVTYDIRETARQRTNEALMNRWGYSKKK